MLIEEFDLICARQAKLNPDFPDEEDIARLRSAVFFQRPLKPVEPGFCSFFDNEIRLMKAHPDAEAFILYQKVNELRLTDGDGFPLDLTKEIRDQIVETLLSGKDVSWTQLRRKAGLGKDEGRISLEEAGDKKLTGSAMAYRFKGTDRKPGPFADTWDAICADPLRLSWLLDVYKKANTDEELKRGLAPLGLNDKQTGLAMKCNLPDGHLNISKKAVDLILLHLKADVITYSEACKRAGLHHSDKRDGEVFDTLPYYNEISGMKRFLGHGTGDPKDKDKRDVFYGRIANPTVHVGLNQLRRLVNAMIAQFGRPDEIVLELSRDLKKNQAQKEKLKRENAFNRKANDSRKEDLGDAGFYQRGDRIRTREALQRMRLWEELGKSPSDRRCPYSGKPITSLAVLMSDEVEIEHILPRSRTLDDSMANKTVSFREWNRLKRNLSPEEAAERFPDKFNLEGMVFRSRTMPVNKSWRFQPDAMARFDEKDGLAARLLTETQHFGVVARHYLSKLSPADPEQAEMKVWVTSGRLTSELRRKWGLHLGTNHKNRNDHRHHALDAAVIGVTDRSLINRLSREASRDEENGVGRILADIDEPYEGFTDQVNAMVRSITVSHRPNHRVAGQMHLEGNYGKVRENEANLERGDTARGNLVVRRDLLSLTPKMIGQVRDPKLRRELEGLLADAEELSGGSSKERDKALLEGLQDFQRRTGTRRVRCLYPKDNAVPLGKDDRGQAYKHAIPAENLFVDIVELEDGSWKAVWVDIFEAYDEKRAQEQAKKAEARGEGTTEPAKQKWQTEYPGARFIMRLYKGDTLQLFDEDGVNRVKVVHGLHAVKNRLQLAEHLEAGALDKRHKVDKELDAFRWDLAAISLLKERRPRRVRIDDIGRIRTVEHGCL